MPSRDEDAFTRFAREVFDEVVRREPVFATFIGIHLYDGLLPRNSRAHHEEMLGLVRGWLDRLERLPASGLSRDAALDARLLRWWLRLEEFRLATHRRWAGSPDASEILGDGLFVLFAREFAPFPRRLEGMCGRLGAAPHLFEETLEKLDDGGRGAVPLWVEMELEACAQLPSFFGLITAAAGEQGAPPKLRARWEDAVETASRALDEYSGRLRAEILPAASGEWLLGREAFEELLRRRELGMDAREILAYGERMLASLKEERRSIAREIDPGTEPEEVLARIKDNHPPDFVAALALYRESIRAARSFIVQRDLATLPPGEELRVIETPEYLRHTTPFAAYFQPAKFDSEQVGVYIVTPCAPDSPMMRHHGRHEIKNVSVHEGYPGHHLQLSCANTHPSLVRALAHATETVEGWAHYCEAMMREQGYDASPEFRMVQNADLVWRACRIIVDIKLHAGGISFEQAVEFMVSNIGMEREGAVAEVKRYTQYPAYQLSYLLGKKLIEDLKAEVHRQMGPRFSEKFFHDTLLYSGSLPASYLREVFREKVKDADGNG